MHDEDATPYVDMKDQTIDTGASLHQGTVWQNPPPALVQGFTFGHSTVQDYLRGAEVEIFLNF